MRFPPPFSLDDAVLVLNLGRSIDLDLDFGTGDAFAGKPHSVGFSTVNGLLSLGTITVRSAANARPPATRRANAPTTFFMTYLLFLPQRGEKTKQAIPDNQGIGDTE